MPTHKPGSVWGLRSTGGYQKDADRGLENGYVRTTEEGGIEVVMFYRRGPVSFTMKRSTARLLVRRITQCLEDTK